MVYALGGHPRGNWATGALAYPRGEAEGTSKKMTIRGIDRRIQLPPPFFRDFDPC
jgi:hypothetical protein